MKKSDYYKKVSVLAAAIFASMQSYGQSGNLDPNYFFGTWKQISCDVFKDNSQTPSGTCMPPNPSVLQLSPDSLKILTTGKVSNIVKYSTDANGIQLFTSSESMRFNKSRDDTISSYIDDKKNGRIVRLSYKRDDISEQSSANSTTVASNNTVIPAQLSAVDLSGVRLGMTVQEAKDQIKKESAGYVIDELNSSAIIFNPKTGSLEKINVVAGFSASIKPSQNEKSTCGDSIKKIVVAVGYPSNRVWNIQKSECYPQTSRPTVTNFLNAVENKFPLPHTGFLKTRQGASFNAGSYSREWVRAALVGDMKWGSMAMSWEYDRHGQPNSSTCNGIGYGEYAPTSLAPNCGVTGSLGLVNSDNNRDIVSGYFVRITDIATQYDSIQGEQLKKQAYDKQRTGDASNKASQVTPRF